MACSEGGLRWGLLTLAVKSGFESLTCRRPGARPRQAGCKDCCIHTGSPRGRQPSACTACCGQLSSVRTQHQMLRASHISVPSGLGSCQPDHSQAPGGWDGPEVGPVQDAMGPGDHSGPGKLACTAPTAQGTWGRVLGLSHPQDPVCKGTSYGSKICKPSTEVKYQTLGKCLLSFEPHNSIPGAQTSKSFYSKMYIFFSVD